MSLYGVNKAFHLTQTDLKYRELMKTDPAAAMKDLPLTDEERQALLAGDVAKLYKMGVHTFLMSRLPRFDSLGLSRDEYIKRMQTLL